MVASDNGAERAEVTSENILGDSVVSRSESQCDKDAAC